MSDSMHWTRRKVIGAVLATAVAAAMPRRAIAATTLRWATVLARDTGAMLASGRSVHLGLGRSALRPLVEKELGLAVEDDANALRGAVVMGGSFGVAALVPILPYLLLPVTAALWVSVILSGAMLFAMGALKSRWTCRSWLTSGLEIFALGAIAGIAGYFFGTLLPAALGVAGIPG